MSSGRGASDARWVSGKQLSLGAEVESIIERAQAGEVSVVTLGRLALFSAASGDAWLLDLDDHLGLPLANGGEDLPVHIEETDESFAIEWTHTYQIQGDTIVVMDDSGRGRAIIGYPVRAIRHADKRTRKLVGGSAKNPSTCLVPAMPG